MAIQIVSISHTKFMRCAHYVISGAVVVENGAPEPFRLQTTDEAEGDSSMLIVSARRPHDQEPLTELERQP
jgi:hypothetical protein